MTRGCGRGWTMTPRACVLFFPETSVTSRSCFQIKNYELPSWDIFFWTKAWMTRSNPVLVLCSHWRSLADLRVRGSYSLDNPVGGFGRLQQLGGTPLQEGGLKCLVSMRCDYFTQMTTIRRDREYIAKTTESHNVPMLPLGYARCAKVCFGS